MKKYIPAMHYPSIYEINYQKLKEKNIKNLLFDLDNTVVKSHEKKGSKEARKLFETLKQEGFKVILFSNSPKKRVRIFEKELNVESHAMSIKPLPIGFYKVVQKYKLKKEETAIIGDQILTDIVGGNTFAITTILVNPIEKKDFWLTKINRYRENKIIDKLEKKGLWKRDVYDK